MRNPSYIRTNRNLQQIIVLLAFSCALCSCYGTSKLTKTINSKEPSTAQPESKQRLLELEHTLNTRDMGGYSTSDGRTVKWGMLYRSDSIANLNSADLLALKNLRLKAVTDFRSETERAEAPDRLPNQSPAIDYRTLAINDPAVDVAALGRKFYSGQLTESELIALTDRRAYINNEALSSKWGEWIGDLARPTSLPHLFHCTAGKDRTGFAAAIVLLILGVPTQTVMQDFMLSNQYLSEKIESNVAKIQANSKTDIDAEILRQVIGVSSESLKGAIAAMEAKYGSIDAYIEQGLGIDRATRQKLQTLLLE